MNNGNVQQNPLKVEPCVFTCQSCLRVSNGYETYVQCNRLLYAQCSKNYVFLFITRYKNPYLDLVKILSGGWDNIFAGTSYSN